MDEDPFLEEGDKLVFLSEMVEMLYFSPTEWIVNVFATLRTVSFFKLFPDHLFLQCRQWGQCTSNIVEDVPFMPWYDFHFLYTKKNHGGFHFYS